MRRLIATLAVIFISLYTKAQVGGITSKVLEGGAALFGKNMHKLLEKDPLTTNFSDCDIKNTLPSSFGNDSIKIDLCTQTYDRVAGFILAPGFYKAVFKSFCLKAGTHAPGKGDGYLYALLKGPQAEIVNSILSNWGLHQEIKQHDVQLLLWAIIAKANFKKLSTDLQLTAAQLLTTTQLLYLSNYMVDFLPDEMLGKLTRNMHAPLKAIAEIENKMRGLYYHGNVDYRKMEQLAMLAGIVPAINNNIQAGTWGLHPDGYYIRYMPRGYSVTVVEIYVPPTLEQVRFISAGDVAVPANASSQRLGQSNILICESDSN